MSAKTLTRQPDDERARSYTTHRGEQNYGAKLNDAKVREIRRLYTQEGWRKRDIADWYGVNAMTIHCVLIGRTWKHVE